MTAEQAKEYGVVDDILIKQKVEVDDDRKVTRDARLVSNP